jgi:hypothetical protein
MKKYIIILALFVAAFLFAHYHGKMNSDPELRSLKAQFASVVKEGRPRHEEINHPDGTTVLLNYGGRLDEIVKKRDALLRKKGYIGLGRWSADEGTWGSPYPSFHMIYIKVH